MPTKRARGAATGGRSKKSTVQKPSTSRSKQSPSESRPAKAERVTQRAKGGSNKAGATAAKPRGIMRRAASSVGRALSRVTGRGKNTPKKVKETQRPVQQPRERAARLEADIPMDRIAATYTPNQTSLKSPFRASGADRQSDQEFARGVADDRWNDEDQMTNKSGDPRIGTHGRSYEPGEARAASVRNRKGD